MTYDRLRCQPDFGGTLNTGALVRAPKSLASRGWVGVAADFWAFDSMRPPPQPIPCHLRTWPPSGAQDLSSESSKKIATSLYRERARVLNGIETRSRLASTFAAFDRPSLELLLTGCAPNHLTTRVCARRVGGHGRPQEGEKNASRQKRHHLAAHRRGQPVFRILTANIASRAVNLSACPVSFRHAFSPHRPHDCLAACARLAGGCDGDDDGGQPIKCYRINSF